MTDKTDTPAPTAESTDGGGKPRTRAEERADAIRTPTRAELAERIEQLERELVDMRTRAEESLRSWQRSAADFANYRRRITDERAEMAHMAKSVMVGKLLSVLDDFDRALDSVPPEVAELGWIEGIRLVERKLRGVLESEGVTAIDALGTQFDPNLHEAVLHEDTADHPDNEVIGELQRGYRLGERVIRPALVTVANNPNRT